MNTVAEKSLSTSRPRSRLQFSLLSLLGIMTAACIFLTWWMWPQPNTVVSLIHLSAASQPNAQREARALLKSTPVLSAAIEGPSVSKLPMIQAKQDPIDWLHQELTVDFPHPEIMRITLTVLEQHGAQGVELLDNVVDEFLEAVAADQRELAGRNDAFAAEVFLQPWRAKRIQPAVRSRR